MAEYSPASVDNFDPLLQNITFYSKDGVKNAALMGDINLVLLDMAIGGIQQGAQMGACVVVAGILLIMSSRDSMRKPIFMLNFASLVLAFIRSLFSALYYTSPWAMFYTQFSNDLSYVQPIHYSYSYVSTIILTLVTITVNTSLILQAHAVCTQLHRRWQRLALVGVSILIVLILIGFRIAQCVLTIQGFNSWVPASRYWVLKTSIATNMLALLWFMGIFMWKLMYTVYVRHTMGWARMGVFKTLVIASCFTMVIPFIFTAMELSKVRILDVASWALTTAALFLPLSTIWAKAAMDEEAASLRFGRDSDRSANLSSGMCSSHFASQTSTVAISERKGSIAPLTTPINKSTIDTIIEHATPPRNDRDSTEIDLERMGVRINRSYAVDNGR